MTVLPNPDYLSHPKFKTTKERIDRQTTIAALQRFIPAFERTYLDWMDLDPPDLDARIGAGDEVLGALQQCGFALLSIDERSKAELCALCEPYISRLEAGLSAVQGKPKFRDMNLGLGRDEAGPMYDVVAAILRDLNVFPAAQAYARRPLRIKKLFVQINNEQETAVRYGPIDGRGLPSLKTDYWHIDSDVWPCVKVIIYLSPVELDQGPLRYVTGSHRQPPAFETVVRKTNDTLKLPAEQFLALPDEFRMHALFGPFLSGSEPQVEQLLEREQPVYGGGADLILFDNNGVHRGGFVRSGTRRIVQCLFQAA